VKGLLIGSVDKNKLERCGRIDLLKAIDYTSLFTSGESAKVIGFYGHLLIKDLEIYLADITAAFFLEVAEIKEEWKTQSLSLLRNLGWHTQQDSEEEKVAAKDEYKIRLKEFVCSECGRLVFSCLLYYPITDKPPDLPVKHPWCWKRSMTMMPTYRPYDVRTRGKSHLAREISLQEATNLLLGCVSVAFTGAGISKASGIPTFSGAEGLEAKLSVKKEGLLDEFYSSLFEKPDYVVTEVAKFQASFLTAKPNNAHLALAKLERMKILNCIITENGDGLHQEAGSSKVLEICELDGLRKHFSETRDGWDAIDDASLFLVIGVCWDEHGIIEYARDRGLKILAICPEKPSFLTEGDFYLHGKAEELLPKILRNLSLGKW